MRIQTKAAGRLISIWLLALCALATVLIGDLAPGKSGASLLVANAEKMRDILFLKGKFILKDKKGSIVISDDSNKCHCPL